MQNLQVIDNSNHQPSNSNADNDWGEPADDFNQHLIQGELLKCVDGYWSIGRDRKPLPPDTRLVAVGAKEAWVRFGAKGTPPEYRIRKAGEPFPQRHELGDLDESAWPDGLDGKPSDPWKHTRYCYFTDPKTAEIYTFAPSSMSGRRAVNDLHNQILRMRLARPGRSPVIEFLSAPFKAKVGPKMAPRLKVVGWVGGDDDEPSTSAQAKPPSQLPANGDMNDIIPF
jgi:hypothetical protein